MTEYFKLDVSRTNLQKLGFSDEVINELYAVFYGGNILTNDEIRSVIEQCFDTRISSSQIRSTIYNLLSDDKFGNSNPPETIAGWLFLDEKNDIVERLTDEFVEKYGRRSTTLIQIYDFLRNHPYYSDKVIPNLNFEWINETKVGVIKNIKSFKLKLKINEILKQIYPENENLINSINKIEDYSYLVKLYDRLKKDFVNDIDSVAENKRFFLKDFLIYKVQISLGSADIFQENASLIEYIRSIEDYNDLLSLFNYFLNEGIIDNSQEYELEIQVDRYFPIIKRKIENGDSATTELKKVLDAVKSIVKKCNYDVDISEIDELEEKKLYERLTQISKQINDIIDDRKIEWLNSNGYSNSRHK